MAPSPLKDLQGKGLRLYWGQLTLHAFVLNPNNYNTIKPWNIFGPMFYLSSNWALLKLTKKGEITEIALMTLQCFFFSAQWMETKLMGMIGYPLKGIFHPKTGWPTSHFFPEQSRISALFLMTKLVMKKNHVLSHISSIERVVISCHAEKA